MTPEAVGYAMNCLFEAGALEVYTVPVGMKKNRPGTLVCVLCNIEQRDDSVDSFSNSVRVHISSLRRKLRTALGYDPIRNVIGEGYQLREKL